MATTIRISFQAVPKVLLPIILVILLTSYQSTAQVAINNDGSIPHESAMLEIKSTGKGFLPPRMNEASLPQNPATGLMVYVQDGASPGYRFFDGTNWQKFGISLNDFWKPLGPDIYFNSGKVAIGINVSEGNWLNVSNTSVGKAAVRGFIENQGVTAIGMLAVSDPSLIGLPFAIVNASVLGIKPNTGANGAAICGWNNDDNAENYGGLFLADGANNNYNYGIFAQAKGAATNYAGKFKGRIIVEGLNGTSGAADSISTLVSSQVTHKQMSDTRALEGISLPNPGYGIGVYGEGGYIGIRGKSTPGNYLYASYGIYAECNSVSGAGSHVGVYATASGGAANWAGYFDNGSVHIANDLRIGTTTQATGYALSVNGKIACEDILIEPISNWPDYVFQKDYKLKTIKDLNDFITIAQHLPGIPSSEDVKKSGYQVSEMQVKLLEKIEELTLYIIQQDKKIAELQYDVNALKQKTNMYSE